MSKMRGGRRRKGRGGVGVEEVSEVSVSRELKKGSEEGVRKGRCGSS